MSRLDPYRTLVLDRAYQPLRAVGWERAITMELCERVEVLEYYDARVHTAQLAFRLPAVIRIPSFFRRRPHRVALTRRNLLLRDNYSCQYCGISPLARELTLDHVQPRSRGGPSSWENLVTACGPCNRRKGNKTPDEASMPLRNTPTRPNFVAVGKREAFTGTLPPQWTIWLQH